MHRFKIYLKSFYVISFLLVTAGSGCNQVIRTPNGGFRPKNPNFSFAKNPFELSDNQMIDTTTLYFAVDKDYSPPQGYNFYRFFSNGRLHIGYGLESFPSIETQNDINTGWIGYYKINGQRIELEVFEPVDNGRYNISYGEIKGDSIIFTKNKSGYLWKQKTDIRLYKVVDPERILLYSKPNW